MMSDEVIDLTLSSSDSDVASAGESDTDGSPLQQVPDSAIVDKLKRYVFLLPHCVADHYILVYACTTPVLLYSLLTYFWSCRRFVKHSSLTIETILSDADEESTSSV